MTKEEQRVFERLNGSMTEAKGPLKYVTNIVESAARMSRDSIAGRLVRRVIAPGAYDSSAKTAGALVKRVMGDTMLREYAVRHDLKDIVEHFNSAPEDTESRKALKAAAKEFNAAAENDPSRAVLAKRISDLVDKMKVSDARTRFAIACDTGDYSGLTPQERGYAERIKALTDEATRRIQSLGALTDAMEFYLGRIWKPRGEKAADTPAAERRVLGMLSSKSPLTGPKTFMRERYHDTFEAALKSGLEPVYDNPITAHLAKLTEMNKFYGGTLIERAIKALPYVHFFKQGEARPEGYAELKGREFTRPPTRVITTDANGKKIVTVPMGAYFAPEGMAHVLNNFVSKGLEATPFGEAAKAVRVSANMMNSMQLSFSLFHPIATTIEAQISRVGLGISQAMRGQFGKAAVNIVGGISPTNWHTNMAEGDKLIKAVLDPKNAPPEMLRLVHAMGDAGGRIWLQRYLRPTNDGAIEFWRKGGVGQALREAANHYPDSPVRQAFNIAGRALETSMAPIMDYIVPRQKLGVFSRMAKDLLDNSANMTDLERTLRLQDIWETVDNRLGEMNYDNLFWNKTTKDLSFLMVRSVGWNMGTLREIGGGLFEGAQQGMRFATGRHAEWTHRMSYLIALPLVTGLYGAMYQYLSTGKGPQELKDLFFPRTGFALPDGEHERVSIPSYMRDVYAWSLQPWQTAQNKMHPAVSLFAQAVEGKDYYGDIIANRDDPVVKQVEDIATWFVKGFLPFSFVGESKMRGHPFAQRAAALAGIQPTPGYIADPEAQKRWEERQHRIDVGRKRKHEYRTENPPPPQPEDQDESEPE